MGEAEGKTEVITKRLTAIAGHGKLPPPPLVWIVLHPTDDNPPVILHSAPTFEKAKAWARKNQPDGDIVSLDRKLSELGFHGISTIVRKYEPDTGRQVQALKTLLDVAESK